MYLLYLPTLIARRATGVQVRVWRSHYGFTCPSSSTKAGGDSLPSKDGARKEIGTLLIVLLSFQCLSLNVMMTAGRGRGSGAWVEEQEEEEKEEEEEEGRWCD